MSNETATGRKALAVGCGGFTHVPGIPPSDGVMRTTFGTSGFFGYQVTPSGETFWFQNMTRKTEPNREELDAVSDDEWREELLGVHRHDDVPSLPMWHRGPGCLIGDAAHAASPHAGQGASTALEDAIVLARCLRDLPDVEGAFAAFERLRKDRVERIVAGARRRQPESPVQRAHPRPARPRAAVFPQDRRQGRRADPLVQGGLGREGGVADPRNAGAALASSGTPPGSPPYPPP